MSTHQQMNDKQSVAETYNGMLLERNGALMHATKHG
jgi:hypothetical protein